MRKAFTLVEVLVVLAVMPLVLLVLSGVYTTFIRDIPRSTRVLQVNTTVLHALRQMHRDVDRAIRLPEQFEDRHTGARTLLIEQTSGVICYQFEDGRLVRTMLSKLPTQEQRVWRVPDAVIVWRLWTRDGQAYAVEIHSHVQERVGGHIKEKLANSQVFFLQELVREGENP